MTNSDGLVRIAVEEDGSGFAEGAVDRALIVVSGLTNPNLERGWGSGLLLIW